MLRNLKNANKQARGSQKHVDVKKIKRKTNKKIPTINKRKNSQLQTTQYRHHTQRRGLSTFGSTKGINDQSSSIESPTDGRVSIDEEGGFVPTPQVVSKNTLKIKHLTKQIQAIDSTQPQREAWWIISSKSGIPEKLLRQAAKAMQPDVPDPDLDLSLPGLLTESQLAAVHDALKQRIEYRKPLQYVLGDVEFCKLKFQTREGVLIPRPETEQITSWLVHQIKLYNQYVLYEHESKQKSLSTASSDGNQSDDNNVGVIKELIDKKVLYDYTEQVGTFEDTNYPLHRFRWSWYDAIENPFQVQQKYKKQQHEDAQQMERGEPWTNLQQLRHSLESVRVFDLCCGSGNIALSLAAQFPKMRVVGADIDEEALALSRLNQANLHLENAQFFHCDLFQNSIFQATPKFEERPIPRIRMPNPMSGTARSMSAAKRMDNITFNQQERFVGLYDLPMLSSLTDIIVSNPPYIRPSEMSTLSPEVLDWENRFALTPFDHIYGHPELGQPIELPASYTARTPEQRAKLPKWPTVQQIHDHALPFYERIIKNAPRLLTHNEHYIPKQNIKFPRLVLEIGHPEQAKLVADMASYMFDVEIYLDAFERPRWVVGYEPRGYH